MVDFNVRRALAVGGHDENGGSVVDADALAGGLIGLDHGGELALRVDGKGQSDVVTGGKFGGELPKHIGIVNRGLIGEDLVAVLVAQCLTFGVKPVGVDRSFKAPCVIGKREVEAQPGNLVLGCGRFHGGILGAADRALHIRKLDHGHANASGRLEDGGVLHTRSARRSCKLGVGTQRGGPKKREKGKTEQQAGALVENGQTTGNGKNTKHSD
jgi:hypothetical protein